MSEWPQLRWRGGWHASPHLMAVSFRIVVCLVFLCLFSATFVLDLCGRQHAMMMVGVCVGMTLALTSIDEGLQLVPGETGIHLG